MTIIKKCWCGMSLRKGSFMSGFFSLGLYTFVVAGGIILLHTDSSTEGETILTSLMVMFAGICVITSILLLVGLCVESRSLMLPWMFSVTLTTVLHLVTSFYLFGEWHHEFTLILFFVDLFICALNTYSILCVISRYQECNTDSHGNRNERGHPFPVNYEQSRAPPRKEALICETECESTSTSVLSVPSKNSSKGETSSSLQHSEHGIDAESTSTSAIPSSEVTENFPAKRKCQFYHSVVRLERVCNFNWRLFGRNKSPKTFLSCNSDSRTEDTSESKIEE